MKNEQPEPPEGAATLPPGVSLKRADWVYMAGSGGWRRLEGEPWQAKASPNGLNARDI